MPVLGLTTVAHLQHNLISANEVNGVVGKNHVALVLDTNYAFHNQGRSGTTDDWVLDPGVALAIEAGQEGAGSAAWSTARAVPPQPFLPGPNAARVVEVV